MSNKKAKTLIIGSGPAGYTAGIYAARAGLEPVMIAGFQPGGQLTTTSHIENFPGFPEAVGGMELMDLMRKQAENLGTQIINDHVKSANLKSRPFVIETEMGEVFEADTVIISTGSSPKKAGIVGEEKFWGFGVSTCATCDGFFYRGKDVAIVGGGNSAVAEALFLSNFTNSITIITRGDTIKAEKIMIDKALENPKITIKYQTIVEEITGTDKPKSVTGMRIKNLNTGVVEEMEIAGIFIAVGHSPNTSLFEGQIDLDEHKYIKIGDKSCKTNIDGVFAAGDVTNPKYKQAVVAASLGCIAALEAEKYLSE